HRIVSQTGTCVSIDRAHELLHGFPRYRARQLLSSIDSWGIDLDVEAHFDLPSSRQKSKKRAQVCDFMLKRRSIDSLTCNSNECFDRISVDVLRKHRAGFLICTLNKKLRCRPLMPSDGDYA